MNKFFNGKMKKVISLTAVATMAACIFSACGTKNVDKDENGRTIVSVGSWPSKEGKEKDNIEARKTRFEEANKDEKINPDRWSFDLKSFYAKAAGGQLPTLYDANYTEASQIMDSNYSSDLTDVLKQHNLLDKFNKDVLNIVSKNGKIYAYPYSAYVFGLAYNVDLFEKAGLMESDGTPKQPKNWDEVVEFAQKIKAATGKAGLVFPTSNNYGGWIFTSLAWSFGADFMKQDDSGKWKACFDSTEAAAALQWIKDLKWKYDVLPANSLIDGTELFKLYGTGEAAMIISAGDLHWKVSQYEMKPESIGIMAMPSGPKKHVTLMGGKIYAVSNKATKDQIDASVRWIETAYSPEATDEYKENMENAINLSLDTNQIVTIKSMSVWNNDSDAVKFENKLRDEKANANPNHVKLYNDFVADMEDCELRPEEPVCAQELYGILDSCIQEVLTNKDADPAELLKKANSDFQANYLDNLDY